MLHDLYLLSCYFDASSAIVYEDDLKRRYGDNVVAQALAKGWLDFYRTRCLRREGRCFYRLSQKGLEQVQTL